MYLAWHCIAGMSEYPANVGIPLGERDEPLRSREGIGFARVGAVALDDDSMVVAPLEDREVRWIVDGLAQVIRVEFEHLELWQSEYAIQFRQGLVRVAGSDVGDAEESIWVAGDESRDAIVALARGVQEDAAHGGGIHARGIHDTNVWLGGVVHPIVCLAANVAVHIDDGGVHGKSPGGSYSDRTRSGVRIPRVSFGVNVGHLSIPTGIEEVNGVSARTAVQDAA